MGLSVSGEDKKTCQLGVMAHLPLIRVLGRLRQDYCGHKAHMCWPPESLSHFMASSGPYRRTNVHTGEPLLQLGFEFPQHHFHHVLVVKAGQEISLGYMCDVCVCGGDGLPFLL
jgi:hypothetical protein